MLTNLSFEPVGPGDLVYVSVANSPEITRSYRISPDGTLILALLKAPIAASGKLPSEMEKEIAHQIRDQKILVDPVVCVAQ
jgi:polysaccharide export outer membrane protein